MSSSQRSWPSRPARKAAKCPTCGAARVVRMTNDVVLRVHGRRYRIPDVPHERCQGCRERVFGIEVAARFDAAVLKRRSKRVALGSRRRPMHPVTACAGPRSASPDGPQASRPSRRRRISVHPS
jgi:YgiT-type zinc finger domain-containing protein